MPINPTFVGKVYPTTEAYQVSREKLREFATAIGDHNPVYHEVTAAQAHGYTDVVAPPTFAFALTMRALATVMFDPDLAMVYPRIVHGEQSFHFRRPIIAGDELVVDAVITSIDSTGRNEFLTLVADVRTTAGETVVTTTSVLASRGTGAAA